MKSSLRSDEIFSLRLQMKLNPSFSPREAGFHREAISSTAGGFIPSARTDLTEKSHSLLRMAFFLAGAEGLEPTTHGFGDQYSTN